jgi:hypothetical protein
MTHGNQSSLADILSLAQGQFVSSVLAKSSAAQPKALRAKSFNAAVKSVTSLNIT